MIQQLGRMLLVEREKKKETQKNIAEGIISIPELCRVERGEMEIDYFTLQALFERLGKAIDKLELAVSSNEYDAIACHIEFEHSIESWDGARLWELLHRYSVYNDKKRPLHRQYLMMMYAMWWYVNGQDYASCLHWMEQALACTLRVDWRQMVRSGQCFCNQEIKIILAIAYCQWKLGSTDGLTGALEQLCRYILSRYTDAEEQVKVYPHCVCLLGQLYLEQDRVEEAYALCTKGRKSLSENGSLSPFWEILELEEHCLKRLGKEAELMQCRKYQGAIAFLYRAAGRRLESNMMAAFMKSSFQGELVITNELVRDLREAKQLSQEALCEGICAQETLSKIETGRRSPNKKNLYRLLKKMGMERENYYGFVESANYALYEKVRIYNRSYSKGKIELSRKLLHEIENELDMTKLVNKQFVEMGHIYRHVVLGELPYEQAVQQLYDLVCLTMPPLGSDSRIYRVPFRTEYTIWNHIAINLRRDHKIIESICIYDKLMQCYKKSKVLMKFHAVPGMLLYLNYAAFLEVHDELEKALEIGIEGLEHSIECCRGDFAGDILTNLSLVFRKQGLAELEEQYLRYGYHLICLYGREDDTDIVKKEYQNHFHKSINDLP